MGKISSLIENKSQQEKARIKLQELAKVKLENFSHDGYDVVLSNLHSKDGVLTVTLRAFKDKTELRLDNPFQFHNPPILIHKGDVLVEDPKQALKEMIINTIKAVT